MNGINNNLTFTSRNRVIRKADDIARQVAREYPMLSATKYAGSPNCMKFVDSIKRLSLKIASTRKYTCRVAASTDIAPEEKIRKYIDAIKTQKIGNCAEITDIAMILAYMHNLKNLCIVELKTAEGDDLDHVALCINKGKKPYIIDAWLGFADYMPNVIEKYKTVYRNHFQLLNIKGEKIEFIEYQYNPIKKALDNISNIELFRLRREIFGKK